LYLFNYNLSLSFRNKMINKLKWIAWAKLSLVFAGLRPLWYCLNVFSLHVLNKNDNIINDLSGTFWKTQKIIPSWKNQSALIAKISSSKKQKKKNCQPANENKRPQGLRGTRYWAKSVWDNLNHRRSSQKRKSILKKSEQILRS